MALIHTLMLIIVICMFILTANHGIRNEIKHREYMRWVREREKLALVMRR